MTFDSGAGFPGVGGDSYLAGFVVGGKPGAKNVPQAKTKFIGEKFFSWTTNTRGTKKFGGHYVYNNSLEVS